MPKPLTVKSVVKMISDVVAGNEDFVYDRDACVYVASGQPSCLVGHVLIKNDIVPAGDLGGYAVNGMGIGLLLKQKFPDIATDRAAEILKAVQMAQDSQQPWGVCVKIAKHMANNPGVDAYDVVDIYANKEDE